MSDQYRATTRSRLATIAAALVVAATAHAAQTDINGPPGSVAFGTSVAVLPNGNFVVTDPTGVVSGIGAVYLYSSAGLPISVITGSTANDNIGSGGIVVLSNGNFVFRSPFWNNTGATHAGAVTWVNGNTGLSGVVSSGNSLVGTFTNDLIGNEGVVVLNNGNYVVVSQSWNNGVANNNFGAVTWGSGTSGISGVVSSTNSLVGSIKSDAVGGGPIEFNGVTALNNGNYVIASPQWNGGAGAVTWGDGMIGVKGLITSVNSLVGANGDLVGRGGITALTSGNYVVASPRWSHGGDKPNFGAATWGNGLSGVTGAVSSSNSLTGTTMGDAVGQSVTALSNGHYVVASPTWNNGVANSYIGAATWGNGVTGTTIGIVSAGNSLIGTMKGDSVAGCTIGVTALSNGNYVVCSDYWQNGVMNSHVGAATWVNGAGHRQGR